MTVQEAIERYGKLAKKPFNWKEFEDYLTKLHSELTEPRWAIDDPIIRAEFEKIVVDGTARLILEKDDDNLTTK